MDALKSLLPDDEAADASRLSVPNASAKPSQSGLRRGSFRVVKENETESVHSHGNNHAMININPRETNGERNLSPAMVKTVKISREAIDQDEDDEHDDMETGNIMMYNKPVLNSEEELKEELSAKKSLASSTGSNGASIRPILEGPNAILYHMIT